jgi:lysophospholipase L1-like esterase
MRTNVLIFCLLLLMNNLSVGQEIFDPLILNQLPQDNQLYARNEKDIANIPISGSIILAGWKYISVVVTRENQFYAYQRAAITYNSRGESGSFALNPSIKSELANYNIQIYASRTGTDSVLIVERKNIVAGDFYVLYGDSNVCNQNVTPTDYYSNNQFIRSFGRYNQEVQKDYLLNDTTWTQNENYFYPKVGIWGTYLQELIVKKYGIPVAIIAGGRPGIRIESLADQLDGNYKDLLYRVKKSGLSGQIKGFFLWHSVYELFSRTSVPFYQNELKKLMQNLQTDYPLTKQYFVFQNGLVYQPLVESAMIRESQRQISTLFPNITLYAASGLKGHDGVHYSIAGYQKCAEELLGILEPLYYGKPQNQAVYSPNIQKIFYTDANRKSIKLIFQEGQNIVLEKDTIMNLKNPITLSLKNNFLQDGNYVKLIDIQSISSEKNTITIQLNTSTQVSTLSYLPPYHHQFSIEFPVFLGPYISNSKGARALTFSDFKVQEGLNSVTDLVAQATINQINLSWKIPAVLPKNTQILLERKSEKEQDFVQITKLKSAVSEYLDSNLPNSTKFDYRLKILADSTESDYAQVSKSTTIPLSIPTTNATILYYNKAQINWNKVAETEGYILERKSQRTAPFITIFSTTDITKTTFIDSTLLPNQAYIYRVSAFNKSRGFSTDSLEVITPTLLAKPELNTTIIFYNSLKISWKAINNAINYRLEKKDSKGNFIEISKPDSKTFDQTETNLQANTIYTYRLKAYGDKTESLATIISAQTPAILSTPQLKAEQITNKSAQLKWQAIPQANQYILERQTAENTAFKEIFRTPNLLEYNDFALQNNQKYTYRLKALGDKTESLFTMISLQTAAMLATPQLQTEQISFNAVQLKWKVVPLATQYLLERQILGNNNFEKIFETPNLLEYNDLGLTNNQNYTYRLKVLNKISDSEYAKVEAKTLLLLANESENTVPFMVFPNPAQDRLSIVSTQILTGNLNIIDSEGRVQQAFQLGKTTVFDINTSGLKMGIYYVQISAGTEIFVRKFMIER